MTRFCRSRLQRTAAALAGGVLMSALVAVVGAGPAGASQGLRDRSLGPVVGQAPPSAPVPQVDGPLPGPVPPAPPAGAGASAVTPAVLAAFGYREQEFFMSGVADAYTFSSPPGEDGRWRIAVEAGSAAAYRTRVVVFTPTERRRFDGTVVVEWDNVTAGADLLPDLVYDHGTPFRDGDAYVGVSAQFVGVKAAALGDPGRYGSLVHPGDSYSYDIFSQAGMAVWKDAGHLLGGLRPYDVIADGESQSAARLVTYIDAFAPVFNVYDGYLVHSRGAGAAPLQQPPGVSLVATIPSGTLVPEPNGNTGLAAVNTPAVVGSRTDLVAPVLTFETQSDVYAPPNGLLSYGPATQADSSGFRLWEVAGTAHADDCLANRCASDDGTVASAIARFDDMLNPPTAFSVYPPCAEPINTGEEGYVLGASLQQLTRWVVTGGARRGWAAAAPPLFAGQAVGEGPATVPVLDAQGNVVGGVRSPAVDVPVATLTGVSTNTPEFCVLAGTTTPLSTATLTHLYPTHGSFVARWAGDTLRLALAGYLTAPDALRLVAAAQASSVP